MTNCAHSQLSAIHLLLATKFLGQRLGNPFNDIDGLVDTRLIIVPATFI